MWCGPKSSEEQNLTKEHITVSTAVMLPTYALFFVISGLTYLFSPYDIVTKTPSLNYVDQFIPIRVWGLIYVCCGLLVGLSLILQNRVLCRGALAMCASSLLAWTVAVFFAGFGGGATHGAWAYPAFVMMACIASLRSLSRDEH